MARSHKTALGLGLFGLGALAGLGAARALAQSSGTAEQVEVEPLGPAAPAAKKTLEKSSTPQAAPSGPRQVAHLALGFTVHIRGGPVYGSGVVLDRDGHVLTADHVIDGLKSIEVSFHDSSKPSPARVIDRDKKLDLALLKIDVPIGAVAQVGSVSDVRMGDEVFAMGSPRKLQFSLSRGIVSYVGRAFDGALYVQTDLPANSGNSGGPVMNERGEVIGISSFILKRSQGLAFAVPIDYAFVRFSAALGARDTSRFQRWVNTSRGGPPKG